MKYITDRIRSLFRLNDTPHRLASAFALGVFIAFSPTIGLHTISCLLLAWVFRLSKLAVLTAAFIKIRRKEAPLWRTACLAYLDSFARQPYPPGSVPPPQPTSS